ncbi:MAG: hypothetical protein JW741_11315 [Sedimentisphaerales bacterium]|nr:hypothetical protein [Sedimentisphaerales bacterium]
MGTAEAWSTLGEGEARELGTRAGAVFQPRAPIITPDSFAGRREQLEAMSDSVAQRGLHIVVFGERGVGKTSLANVIGQLLHAMEEGVIGDNGGPHLFVKVHTHIGDSFSNIWRRAFDEVYWHRDKPTTRFSYEIVRELMTMREALNISDAPSIDQVRRTLAILKRSVFVFDEFDRGSQAVKKAFADLIKALSDYAVDATVVLVGVSRTIDDLVREHALIARSIVQVQLPRMAERELQDILDKASETLEVVFSPEAASLIVRLSQGLPHYTHLIGLHSTREAAKRLSRRIETCDVYAAFAGVVQHSIQNLRGKYARSVHSVRKDALYRQVLLACASAASTTELAAGHFHPADVVRPMQMMLKRPNLGTATFQKHINEFCEEGRGLVLERSASPRVHRYRFRDPLLPPLIFMQALSEGLIDTAQLTALTVPQ